MYCQKLKVHNYLICYLHLKVPRASVAGVVLEWEREAGAALCRCAVAHATSARSSAMTMYCSRDAKERSAVVALQIQFINEQDCRICLFQIYLLL